VRDRVIVLNNPINWIDPWGLFQYSNTAGQPANPEVEEALRCFDKCTGRDTVVTAAREGGHSKGSAHETGEACDIGTNSNPELTRQEADRCYSQCFNPSNSYGQQESNHYHFQTRPGRGGATGFAPGVR